MNSFDDRTPSTTARFWLGDWLIEPDLNRLSSGEQVTHLEPKTMEVLLYLCRCADRVVSAEEIIAEVWGGRPMGDNPVYKSIAKLRRALDDDPNLPAYIQTVPKKGYRLIQSLTNDPLESRTRAITKRTLTRITPIASGLLIGAAVAVAVLWRPATPPAYVRPISAFSGSHSQPSFAPDGKRFAFINQIDGASHVWVSGEGETQPQQLTFGAGNDERPRWSPDGDEILLMRNGNVWSVSARGGEPIELLRDATNPNWSRDGRRIVFERRYEVWVADADGGNQARLAGIPRRELALSPRWPAFGPYGQRVVFFESADTPEGDLWAIDLQTDRLERLTDAPAFGSAPVWSPDGSEIIYSSQRGGSRTLWSVDPVKKTSSALLIGSGDDDHPDMSADGRRIIYSNSRERFLLLQSTLASNTELTLHESRLVLVGPTLSPDRKTIAFFGASPTGGIQLFTLPSDGGPLAMVTTDTSATHAIPRWSPDGQSLYFFHTQTDTAYRRIAATGGDAETVAQDWNWNVANGASIDPSGQRIIYSRLAGQAPVQTLIRNLETATDEAFFATLEYPRWSRDGRSVIGALHTDQRFPGDVAVCPVDGDECRIVAKAARIPMWSADETQIFFVRGFGEAQELFVIDANGAGTERKLMDMAPLFPLGPFYDVNANDDIIWVRHTKEPGAIWIVDR